jgi:hypothetical protein
MESSDDPYVTCKYIKASSLTALCNGNNVAELQDMAFHNVTNAFDKVCFGANEYGIHRATPTEVLHSIQKGWYLYALEGFYKVVKGKTLEFLEQLVERVSMDCDHQSDRSMPRLKFPNGISSYANLQAHETTGVLLLIVIALHCEIGWDTNKHAVATKHSFARNTQHCDTKVVKKYRELFETLLCMEQWLKLPLVKKAQVRRTPGETGLATESPAKQALRGAVKLFVDTVDCKEGNGMKLTKTHSVLHVPDDVAMFGSGKNWDSGPSESNHKENVKKKAALTSLCKHSLEDQVAFRFEESLVIEHAKGAILVAGRTAEDGTIDALPMQRACQECSGSRIKLTITDTSSDGIPCYDSIKAAWDGKKSKFGKDCKLPLPPQKALDYFLHIISDAQNLSDPAEENLPPLAFHCFTDYKIDATNENAKSTVLTRHIGEAVPGMIGYMLSTYTQMAILSNTFQKYFCLWTCEFPFYQT